MKRSLEIMDTTLRDGEQTSGVSYSPKEKLTILKDGIIHLVRNSIDHGIEIPEVRKKLGKDVFGILAKSATPPITNDTIKRHDKKEKT